MGMQNYNTHTGDDILAPAICNLTVAMVHGTIHGERY